VSKIKTAMELQNRLDDELAWRIKEIANLKIVVRTSSIINKNTAVRAALPLLYGHWEGFIKAAAESYLMFVNGQSLKYQELKSCFVVFGLRKKLHELTTTKNAEYSITTLEFLRDELDSRAKLKLDNAINTEANLSSLVFSNIAQSIGINITPYEGKFNLIDTSLLRRRNSIAHGEYLDVDSTGFRDLADEILKLLRLFKNDIENAVSLKLYKV
jgi:hypothetical protein